MGAEIRRRDVIEDGAIQAPLDLAKNIRVSLDAVDDLLKKFKDLGAAIKSSTSVTKLKKETEELTAEQKELDKIQKQLTSTIAKNSSAVIEQQKALAKAKQELKEKIALGDRDALTLNKLNASYKMLDAALKKNIKSYNDFEGAEAKATTAAQNLLRVINLQQKELEELDAEQGRYNRKVGDYTGGILQAYARMKQLEQENGKLVVQQKALTLSTEKERQEYARLAVAIQNNVTQINQYNTVISTTRNSIGGLVSQFLSAAGLVGAVYLVVDAFKSFINVNKEFEKQLSDLAALTEASTQDLVFYREAAISIGAETKRSAKDIVEAFKLIGGARPELLKDKEALAEVTKQAAILANASGLELPEAADALAGALNQLELPASEAGRVINVLAKAAQAGAAEIPQLNEGLKPFGAVLGQVNGSIEEGAALLEVLAERQIKGAEAGTALRNVLLATAAVDVLPKSARKELKEFGVNLDLVKDSSKPLNERLRELSKISKDAAALVKVFGKENYVAGSIVLNNVDKFEELTKVVTGSTSAIDQAKIATDNLTGDQDQLSASTQALALEYGGGFTKALRGVVQGITFFLNILRALPSFISENKEVILALLAAMALFNQQLIISNALILKEIALNKIKVIWTNAVNLATKRLWTTMAANPFGLILVGLAAIIAALKYYDTVSDRANKINAESADLHNDLKKAIDSVKLSQTNLNTSVEDYIKLSPDSQKQLQKEADLRKQTALATLAEIEAKKAKLAQDASELTSQQKALALLGKATGNEQSITLGFRLENVKKIEEQFKGEIDALKAQILEFDNFITDTKKASDEDTAAQAEKEKQANLKLQKFRIEQQIKYYEEIKNLQSKSTNERLAAERKVVSLTKKLAELDQEEDLMKSKLTESERILIHEQYLAAVKEADKQGEKERQKILLEGSEQDRKLLEAKAKRNIETNQAILKDENLSLAQRNQVELDVAQEKQLLLDSNYAREKQAAEGNAVELLRIQEDYQAASEALGREYSDNVKNNFFEVYRKGFDTIESRASASRGELIKNLNDQLAANEVSLLQYSKKREAIEKASGSELLQLELDYAKQYVASQEAQGRDVSAIRRDIADLEVAISEDSAAKQIEAQQRVFEKTQELKESLFNFAINLSSNLAEAENQRLDAQLGRLEENYNKQVELAGGNERQKAALKRKFEADEDRIQKQKQRNARKQAVTEKAINAARTIVNTSRAVSEALPNIPLSILVGALGAIELATILSTPIPQFYKGGTTEGGPIWAGERGFELMKLPNKSFELTPNTATLLSPPAGTEIFNHQDTVKALAMMAMAPTDFSPLKFQDNGGQQVLQEIQGMRRDMKRPQFERVDYFNVGTAVFESRKVNETFEHNMRKFYSSK